MTTKEIKKYNKFLKEYRKKYIPLKYNQIELMDYLLDADIDLYCSISSRGDGKSFNYIGFLLKFAYDFKIGLTFVVRHYELQSKIRQLIYEISTTLEFAKYEDIYTRTQPDYITIGLKDREVALITDLNNASDLKFSSQILKKYPIIIYEEFLALKSDYISDEFEKLKLIYTSIDRNESIDYIHKPKLILLGNPVNFDSPLLTHFNMLSKLEMMKINTLKVFDNIAIELKRNDNVNEVKTTSLFDNKDTSDFTGEFNINSFNVLDYKDYLFFKEKGQTITIDISEENNNMLEVTYYNDKYVLSVKTKKNTCDYCLNLSNKSNKCVYLTNKFFSDRYYKKYEKDIILYENNFTKNYVTESDILMSIKLNKLFNYDKNIKEKNEIQKDTYIEKTLESLKNKFI